MAKKVLRSISIDPVIWKAFQDLVKAHNPDGDTTASAHVERLVERENSRLSGGNVAVVIDRAGLQRQLRQLAKRSIDVKKIIVKSNAKSRINDLAIAYKLDTDHFSNADDVIRRILEDRNKKEGTPMHTFLAHRGSKRELQFFIDLVEIGAKTEEITTQLMKAYETKYKA
jgi:hypothetical protein